jgi:SAM-dependent methyltransferase
MGIRKTLLEFKPVYIASAVLAYPLFLARLSFETLRDFRNSDGPAREPAPPARLRWRVSGHPNKASYLEVGKTIAQNIQDLCESTGRDFYSFEDILDFGSGCGRVIQNFRPRPESCTLYATDIDPDLVSWGEGNLADIRWSVNAHQPPLPFEDNAFDLIYGISVFTHLDEDFQHVWLRELQRVARPGATLILTVHGEYALRAIQALDRSYRDEFHERGFMFFTLSKGRFKLDGFPDFYQATFHAKEYVYNEWSSYFDIVEYVERGIGGYQDAVVLRKPVISAVIGKSG